MSNLTDKIYEIVISPRGYGKVMFYRKKKQEELLQNALKEDHVKCKLTYAVGVGYPRDGGFVLIKSENFETVSYMLKRAGFYVEIM